jgi:branched-chain amino acid transport system substrate-binding protein
MDPFTFGLPTGRRSRASVLGVGLATVALLVGACGTGPTATPGGPGPTATATGTTGAFTPPTDEFRVVTVPSGEPLHIAFWGVLSTADVTLGEDSRRGVQVALEDRSYKYKGHDILLTSEDGQCLPAGGSVVGAKLAADPTLVGLIGSSCSDETVGGIKAITDAGLTTISPSNTRPALTAPDRGKEYAGYLRTAHSDAFQGKAVAEFATQVLKVTKAATIHDGSTYAQALQQVFVDEFKKLGGTVTIQEAVTKDQPDMKSVLTRVAATGPQLLYYPIFIASGGLITRQAPEVAGLKGVTLMGSDGMFSPDFIKAAGTAAEGMYLSSPDFSKFQAGYAAFLEKYKKGLAVVLSAFHAHAYDATNILFAALDKVVVEGPDGTLYVPLKALRDAIYATKDFAGVTGTLTCNASGDCGAPLIAVYQVTKRETTEAKWPPEKPVWP